MAKFNKILVPLDGSKNSIRGLDRAIEISKGTNAEITGFYVFHLPLAAGIKYTQKMKDNAQAKAIKAIGPAMKRVKKQELFSSTKLVVVIQDLKLQNLHRQVNMI